MNIAKYADGNWSVFPQGLDAQHSNEMEERGVRILRIDAEKEKILDCTAFDAGRHTEFQRIYIGEVRWVVGQAIDAGGAA